MTAPAAQADPVIVVRSHDDLTNLRDAAGVTVIAVEGARIPDSVARTLETVGADPLLLAALADSTVEPDARIRDRLRRCAAAELGTTLATAARSVGDADQQLIVLGMPAADVHRNVLALAGGAQRLRPPAAHLTVYVDESQVAATERALRIGDRVRQARTLANTPSDVKNPAWLADQAAGLADGLRVVVRDVDWLAAQGFGGVLAVGAGSASPPNVTIVEHRPRGVRNPHIVLVGKGITFDSGGLSLKPPAAMPLMKTDMSGAAAVLATMAAISHERLPVRVTAIVACAENMPSGSAMRPGDVLRHYGGRTTEVVNTDAEGRLVLADCLTWAVDRLQPDVVIDVATLTGAATVGLGRQHAALYSTSDTLADQLVAAGAGSGDRVWRMPLVDEYRAAIASDIADAANANTDDGTTQGGSITAALFLQPFAADVAWAHLDIAGVGRTESDRADCRKGATGYGVALLTSWLAAVAGSADSAG